MSDDSCGGGCSTPPQTETTDDCACGCECRGEQEPTRDAVA